MPIIKSYSIIKNEIENIGYKLLTKEKDYINTKQLLDLECPRKHRIKKSYYNLINRNKMCIKCSKVRKKSYEEIVENLKKINWELLTPKKNYKNTNTLLYVKCPKKHKTKRKYNEIIRKPNSCSICYGNRKNTLEYAEQVFKKQDLKLLETEYINLNTLMKFKCNRCKKIGKKTLNNAKYYGCTFCGYDKISGENNYNWNSNKEEIDLNKKLQYKSEKYRNNIRNIINGKKEINYYYLKVKYNWLKKDIDNFYDKYKKWKNKEFHVDHIIPIKAFIDNKFIKNKDAINDNILNIINSLNNFQIVTPKENKSKAYKYLQEDFDKYMEQFKES